MAKKPRKPLTDEQRKKKNLKQSQTYGKARKAGFTREQARAIEKTFRDTPDLLKEPTNEIIDLVGGINKFVKWVVSAVEPEDKTPKESKKKPKKKPTKEATKNDPFIESLKGLSKFLLPDGKKIIPSFDIFASQYPDLSARKVMEKYKNLGGKIGSQKGNATIRDIRGLELNKNKITRFKEDREDEYYYDENDNVIDYDFSKPNKNFTKHKERYMYLLGYDVEDKNGIVFRRYIHIPSNDVLSIDELTDEVSDYWEAELDAGDEKYTEVDFVEDSVYLVQAYDTWLKEA